MRVFFFTRNVTLCRVVPLYMKVQFYQTAKSAVKFGMKPVINRSTTEMLEIGQITCLPYLLGVDTQTPHNIMYIIYYG